MGKYAKYWYTLIGVLIVTFSLLGYYGAEVYRTAPPIPGQVLVQGQDKPLFTKDSILDGQTAWQSVGGMQLGSIWGHGAYQAPDWTADWLHRELTTWLELAAQQDYGRAFADLDAGQQAVLKARLRSEYRTNTYDQGKDAVTLTPLRAQAIADTAKYYDQLFSNDPALHKTRESYAMKENTLPSAERRAQMAGFFFWTAWAAATERPADLGGSGATYTNNWPHEPLVGNVPTGENLVWSIMSVVVMMAGVGFLVWGWAFLRKHDEQDPTPPAHDPLSRVPLTPSQRALGKYLFLVVALFTAQVFLGGFTAHYTIEGQTFYGFDVSQWLPYSLVRTWHIQAALFWIATGFLAAGLFLAPLINGGKDPKFQKLGVDILFWALVVVCVGSFIGNYLAIAQIMPPEWNFWLGHQGYEYVDLGRLWQIGKFAGVAFWLVLMARGIFPALPVLRRGPVLRRAHAPVGDGVLALVGGPPVGGRLLRSLRHHGPGLHLLHPGPGLVPHGHGGQPGIGIALHAGRRARHLPPPVLRRHHHPRDGRGRIVQRARSGAAGGAGPRGLGTLAPAAQRHLDEEPEVAPDVLRGRGLLEHAGRGRLRLHDQPAHLAVLHPGPEHHARARPRRALRGLWLPGPGLHADGAALRAPRAAVQRAPDEDRLLVAQRRHRADDLHQPAAHRPVPVPRQRDARHVVRAQRGIPAAALPGNAALGAHLRRRGLHRRRPVRDLAGGERRALRAPRTLRAQDRRAGRRQPLTTAHGVAHRRHAFKETP
jgi:hypothetical protein